MTMRSLKYLSVAMLFAVSSCTYNQYTMTGGGNDDLYGGRYDEAAVVAGNRSVLPADYNTNPDYQSGESAEATDQYYDENYVTARNIQRNVSNQVGYNAGFADGYFAGRNTGFYNNFYGGMYPSWGYPGFNIGFRMGMGSMIGLGYSPFGYSRWNRWGNSFYDPYWDAMAWGDPFMYGGYGYPYYSGFGYPYGGMGYGMYGYNPYRWSNYYPIVINNYNESGVRTRNYGPRTSGSAVSRTALSGSRREPGTTPVARSGARTSASRSSVASANEGYYTRPRSAVSGSAREAAGSSGRVSGARGATTSGNYYYANPNSDRSSYGGLSSARTRTNSAYRASESGRSSSSGYNSVPSRSSNSYSAPSRSYSAPSSTPSRSYSAPSSTPSRSYSAPSSAPSRSYSAPSSGGGGGGSRSSGGGGGGRGPR